MMMLVFSSSGLDSIRKIKTKRHILSMRVIYGQRYVWLYTAR